MAAILYRDCPVWYEAIVYKKLSEDVELSRLRIEKLSVLHVGPVNLQVEDGECICISGPSGSGKSLLLRAIADLLPHDGRLFLDDRESISMRAHDWRRQVGFLPAESQWWKDSVGEHFRECPQLPFEKAGFKQDVCNWQLSRCSTGEKQRLALLRLLSNQPSVLLLDEPTASLDAENTRRVEALVTGYRKERNAAVIWVSHDRAQARRLADHCFRMENGKLVAEQ